MILDTYQKTINLQGHEGIEYMYLCGNDMRNPVGDFVAQCFPEVCMLHLRVYVVNKKSIDLLKESLIEVLEEVEDKLEYDLAVVVVNEKSEPILGQALEGKRKFYKIDDLLPTGMPVYIIALKDTITEEVVENIRNYKGSIQL